MIRRSAPLPAIVSASGAYYVAHALTILAGLISMPIMTRLLSKSEYGLLGLLFATVAMFAVIGGMAFGESAVRLYSEERQRGAKAERDLCNTLLGGSLVAGGVVALFLAGGAVWLDSAKQSRFIECLPLASLLVVIRSVSGVLFQIYRAQERAVAHAATQIFQRYGTMAVAISLLLLYRRDAQTVIAAAIIVEIVAVVARWLDLARRGIISVPALARPILTPALVYGMPLALAGTSRFLLDYADRFLIERLLGLDAVATYSVPHDVAIRLGEMVWAPVYLAALPIMFRLWATDGRHATSRFASDVLTYIIAIMIPIVALFLIHSEAIIVLLASAKYEGASRLLPYLFPGVLLGSINSLVVVGLTVQKRTTTVAATMFAAALFNIGLNLILIPRWQLVGAAIATTLSQGALLVANRLVGNSLDLKPRYSTIAKAIVATVVPVALLYAFGRVPSTSITQLVTNLVVGTGTAALIFVMLEPRVRRLTVFNFDLLATGHDATNGRLPGDRRVLMIARDFPPANTSATRRTASFVRHLPASGWKTSVVAIHEAFHSDKDASAMPQLPADCHVFRAYGFDTKTTLGFRGRYPSLLAFPDREVSWIFDGVRQALRALRSDGANVIWSTSPSVSAHCIAYIAKRRTGLPWIAELRDPWNVDSPGGSISQSANRWLERRLLAAADAIIVTTPGMAADLERRCDGSVRGKIRVIPNGHDEEAFAEVAVPMQPASKFSIAHVGACTPTYRDISGFLRAVRGCIERGDLPAEISIDFVGVGEDRSAVLAAAESLNLGDQVHVSPRVSSHEALAAIVRAPLLLLLQTRPKDDPCVPAKAYEYLRSGAPILAITSAAGETASLLCAFAGVSVVSPDDVEGIGRCLSAAYRSWEAGTLGRIVRDVSRYDRRRLAGEMADLLNEVVQRERR